MKTKSHALWQTNVHSWIPFPLRLALGVIMPAHGAQKLFGWFGGGGLEGTGQFFGQLGLQPGIFWATLTGIAEFFGGLLILIGFMTRLGAAAIGTVMVVAILLVHRNAFFASNQGMEFPLLILAASLALLISGGGAASVDARRSRPAAVPPVDQR